MTYFIFLGGYKNKDESLDKHNSLRDSEISGQNNCEALSHYTWKANEAWGEVGVLSDVQKPTEGQEKQRRKYVPMNKFPETDPNKMEIGDLPGREFRIMVTKMLTKD